MNIEELRKYCIHKKGTTEEFPFDNDTLVFKVMGKMFVMVPLDRWERGREVVVLKFDPERALELRDTYEAIHGGFQMGRSPDARYVNTRHWNTVVVNQDVTSEFLKELIGHSYNTVVKGMTKKMKQALEGL